ncbi:MAG: MFS transporter [Rhizobiales bacterium]|nr:MFS transporter [Hyphomicrobiales bacterium]
MFALRLSLVYGGIFLVIGLYTPFFPAWLDARGLSAPEIAFVMAVPIFAKIVTSPLIAALADRIGNRRLVMSFLAAAATLTSLIFFFVNGFIAILLVAGMLAVFSNPILPLTESVAMTGARQRGLDYGRIRLWGSLSFIGANLIGGLVLAKYGVTAGLPLIAGAFLITFIVTLGLPAPGGKREKSAAVPGLSDSFQILSRPDIMLFLALAGIIQASHAVYYLFSTLAWSGQGMSLLTVGALWAVGVIAEIVLFIWSRPVLARLGTQGLLVIAAMAAVLRWSLTSLEPSLYWLFPIQVLHGITFGAAHLAAVNLIADKVHPDLVATAQTINFAISGIFISLTMFAAGPLYQAYGSGAYLVMSGFGMFVLLVVGWQKLRAR